MLNKREVFVNEDYLRFDFAHFSKMTNEEIIEVENKVNNIIRQNVFSEIRLMTLADAKNTGAMALFGEKYGDIVRVVTFDKDYSVEFCGGTHVKATGQIGLFKITSEAAVASGIRRIEAITSIATESFFKSQEAILDQLKLTLKGSRDLVKSVTNLVEENTELNKSLTFFLKEKAQLIKKELIGKVRVLNGVNLIAEVINLDSADEIKNLLFELRTQIDNLVCVLGVEIKGRASLSVILSENLVKEKNLNANTIVRELSKEIDGGGGGQAFYATAGGTNLNGLHLAIKNLFF